MNLILFIQIKSNQSEFESNFVHSNQSDSQFLYDVNFATHLKKQFRALQTECLENTIQNYLAKKKNHQFFPILFLLFNDSRLKHTAAL